MSALDFDLLAGSHHPADGKPDFQNAVLVGRRDLLLVVLLGCDGEYAGVSRQGHLLAVEAWHLDVEDKRLVLLDQFVVGPSGFEQATLKVCECWPGTGLGSAMAGHLDACRIC